MLHPVHPTYSFYFVILHNYNIRCNVKMFKCERGHEGT